jgi:hypothetical protein
MRKKTTTQNLLIYSFLMLLTNLFTLNTKAQLIGGDIGVQPTFNGQNSNNVFCSGKLLSITSTNCTTGGHNGAPPYTYVWQFDSSASGVWYDIPSSNNCSYNAIVRFSRTRYRRKVTDATNATAFSNIVTSYTCSFDRGYVESCFPQLNIAIGYKPTSIIDAGGTPGAYETPTSLNPVPSSLDWLKSTTSPNAGFSSAGGYGLSYNPQCQILFKKYIIVELFPANFVIAQIQYYSIPPIPHLPALQLLII